MNETSTYNEDAGNTRELIVRIDERTRAMQKTQDRMEKDVTTEFAALDTRMALMEKNMSELQPVKKIVFGAVAFILLSVIGAILAYFVRPGVTH